MLRTLPAASNYSRKFPQIPAEIDYNVSRWFLEPSNIKALTSTSDCRSVAYGDGKWVVGSTSGRIAYGPALDKLVLSNSAAGIGSYVITDIIYGNGFWVAGTSNGRIAVSTDLQNWTRSTIAESMMGTVVNSIKFINGYVIVTGGGGHGAVTQDGINWTDITDNFAELANATSVQIAGIVWDGTHYVVCSGNKRIAYSESLFTPFTAVAISVGTTNFQGIAFDGSTYMAVGTNGIIVTSTDKVNWVQDTSLSAYIGSNDLYGVIWDGYKWFIYGQSGRSAYKYPGQAWVINTSLASFVSTSIIYDHVIAEGRITVVTAGGGIFSTELDLAGITLTARHYRIVVATNASNNYAQMSEVELLDINGIDLLDPFTTTSNQSSFYGGGSTYTASKLYDNDDSTKWTANSGVRNEWVSFSLPFDVTPATLTLKEGANEPGRMPVNFIVQKSLDGIDWVTIRYISGQLAWAGSEKRSYSLN